MKRLLAIFILSFVCMMSTKADVKFIGNDTSLSRLEIMLSKYSDSEIRRQTGEKCLIPSSLLYPLPISRMGRSIAPEKSIFRLYHLVSLF